MVNRIQSCMFMRRIKLYLSYTSQLCFGSACYGGGEDGSRNIAAPSIRQTDAIEDLFRSLWLVEKRIMLNTVEDGNMHIYYISLNHVARLESRFHAALRV